MSMLDEKLDQDVISRLSKELDLGKVASVGNAYVSVDVGTTKVCTLVAQILATGEVEIIGAGKSKVKNLHGRVESSSIQPIPKGLKGLG